MGDSFTVSFERTELIAAADITNAFDTGAARIIRDILLELGIRDTPLSEGRATEILTSLGFRFQGQREDVKL